MDRTGRQPRVHISNSVHHVMIRGNNRQCIFYSDEYFHRFLEIVSQSAEKFDHKIIAYCLMSNHVHLIIHINDSPLSSVMQTINYRYARWLNHKQNRIGHLFQGRFRSLDVNNEEYFINLCRYIHLNPVAANMVGNVGDYPWSSHRYYTENNCPEWMKIDLMTAAIKSKTNLNYTDFIDQHPSRDTWKPALYVSTETGEIVLNEDLLRRLQRDSEAPNSVAPCYLSENQVSNIVCGELNIQKSLLFGPSRNHQVAKQRILLVNYLLQYSDKNITSVAKDFRKTHGTLSRQLKQFNEQPQKYFPVELLKKIELLLSKSMTEN